MTEHQARRPPVAPKPPSYIQQHHVAPARPPPLPSPALQGASSAFRPTALKPPVVSASHNPSASAGALFAATAASNRKQQPQNVQTLQVSSRGRTLTTEKLPIAVVKNTSLSPPPAALRPYAPRSTSAVAAVAASATTSPVRRPEFRRNQGSYVTRQDQSQVRGPGMSTSNDSEALQSLRQTAAALAGAKASMTTAPIQIPSAAGDRPRSDTAYLAHLAVPRAQPSSARSPSLSGTAAAVTATRNAANLEEWKRALSRSQNSSPGAPVSRRFTESPQTIGETYRPGLRASPSQTDSEDDAIYYRPQMTQRTLPAPIAVRADRAAIIAQEAAYATRSGTPVSNARATMTASSLADAMVAGSIAVSHTGSHRASPTSKVPPPVPQRRSHSVGPLRHSMQLMHLPGMRSDAGSQTPKLKPLPVKPMRQTLRSSPDRDEETDEKKRGRRHWRRHPNMHHEGDRRRWRDKVTERERKRYEGVWAANRGLLLDYDLDNYDIENRQDGSAAGELVVNIVARDIWERSRLPGDVLEEIWDLVAQPGLKTLNREEFVVGLWLIDQRLKGRKLPFRVSQSVWSSVRHTQGVKISHKPLQK